MCKGEGGGESKRDAEAMGACARVCAGVSLSVRVCIGVACLC